MYRAYLKSRHMCVKHACLPLEAKLMPAVEGTPTDHVLGTAYAKSRCCSHPYRQQDVTVGCAGHSTSGAGLQMVHCREVQVARAHHLAAKHLPLKQYTTVLAIWSDHMHGSYGLSDPPFNTACRRVANRESARRVRLRRQETLCTTQVQQRQCCGCGCRCCKRLMTAWLQRQQLQSVCRLAAITGIDVWVCSSA